MKRPETDWDLRLLYDKVYAGHPQYGDAARRHVDISEIIGDAVGSDGHPLTLIDVGSGRGAMIKRLVTNFPNRFSERATTAVDTSSIALSDLSVRMPAVATIQASFDELSEDRHPIVRPIYDVVLCSDVVEHLLDEAQARRALDVLVGFARVNPKGLVVITTANFKSIVSHPGISYEGWDGDLHTFKRDFDWWRDEIAMRLDLSVAKIGHGSTMFFAGRVP